MRELKPAEFVQLPLRFGDSLRRKSWSLTADGDSMKYHVLGTIGIAVAVLGGWWLQAAYRLDKRTYLEQDDLREEECGDIGYIQSPTP